MTDNEIKRRKAICDAAGVDEIGELSDGFHTFNGLYEQRMILFAALVKAYKDKAWKSYWHEDGEYCFGGGWFIVGIDTPEGSYTYHYENKYWNMFECVDLPRSKHWDGHTEADAETRLMSLEPQCKKGQWLTSDDMYETGVCSCCRYDTREPVSCVNYAYCPNCGAKMENELEYREAERQWIPCSERLPEKDTCFYLATIANHGLNFTTTLPDDVDVVRWDYDRRKGYNSWHWCTERTVTAWMPLPTPYMV